MSVNFMEITMPELTDIREILPKECKELLDKLKDKKISRMEFDMACADKMLEEEMWNKIQLREFPSKPQELTEYEKLRDREKQKYPDLMVSQGVRHYFDEVSRVIAENWGNYYWLTFIENTIPKTDSNILLLEKVDLKLVSFGNWIGKNTKFCLF
jgi:hypothetical protein